MQIQTFVLGELQTNCYLVFEETGEAAVIDPADEANFISEQILKQNLKLKHIIATHGHFDHILAAWELTLAFDLSLSLHPKDKFMADYMQKSAQYWLKRKIIEKPPEKVKDLKEKYIQFGRQKLKVILTPGHTPGSICLYSPKEKVLFTGDTLFADGVGRTDLPYGSEKNLSISLKKLAKLPENTKIYSGHGPAGALKDITRRA
ncbi:MAG: MBL fold metallo-hydrolase [Candidatus Shapirobacteria bacterium]